MKVMVLLGAPGAGKGTAAEGIKEATRCHHISTGDLLREAVKQGSPVGREAEAYMKRGELVPDDIIIRMVEQQFEDSKQDDLFLLDGFPRTLPQAELLDRGLDRRGYRVGYVFSLEAPRDVLMQRLTGRRICKQCGANYHVTNMPPRKAGLCDRCGGVLYQRPDDQEATIATRLDVFQKQIEGLLAHYQRQGVLHGLDSGRAKEETVASIMQVLEGRRQP